MVLGFRSLKHPAMPDPAASDYYAQCTRYWQESRVWWDNWAADFIRCILLIPAAVIIGIVLVLIWG